MKLVIIKWHERTLSEKFKCLYNAVISKIDWTNGSKIFFSDKTFALWINVQVYLCNCFSSLCAVLYCPVNHSTRISAALSNACNTTENSRSIILYKKDGRVLFVFKCSLTDSSPSASFIPGKQANVGKPVFVGEDRTCLKWNNVVNQMFRCCNSKFLHYISFRAFQKLLTLIEWYYCRFSGTSTEACSWQVSAIKATMAGFDFTYLNTVSVGLQLTSMKAFSSSTSLSLISRTLYGLKVHI